MLKIQLYKNSVVKKKKKKLKIKNKEIKKSTFTLTFTGLSRFLFIFASLLSSKLLFVFFLGQGCGYEKIGCVVCHCGEEATEQEGGNIFQKNKIKMSFFEFFSSSEKKTKNENKKTRRRRRKKLLLHAPSTWHQPCRHTAVHLVFLDRCT